MTTLLIKVGIILVPFYDIIFRAMPYLDIYLSGTRPQREIISLWIALFIAIRGLYTGNIKAINDKWLLIFLGFMFILNFQFGRGMLFAINGVQSNSFWLWKPMFHSIVYFLAYLTIINTDFSEKQINSIVKTIAISGIVMAVYVCLQAFGIDQFFATQPFALNPQNPVHNPHMAGTLGQPTIVAPFIALCLPFLLYKKWNIWAIFCIFVLFLIDSQVASAACILSLCVYCYLKKPQSWIVIAIMLSGAALFLCLNPSYIGDSGRFGTWSQIILDWSGTPFEGAKIAITGAGIGSFQYLFHATNKTVFYQAHNEYIELLYSCGIIGLSLFMAVLFNIFSRAYKVYRRYADKRMSLMVALISSFACICLCAGGTFIWQLGVYRIYTVIIIGIMLNKSIQRGIV